MSLEHNEDLIECPYNKSHQIIRSRMQTHLVKCRKNYPDENKKLCPFDATHHVGEAEYAYHLSVCLSRGGYDTFKYTTAETAEPPVHIAPVDLPPATESWDDEISTSTYDPSQAINQRPLLAKLAGARPAERRAFRMEQRQKHATAMASKQNN